MCTSPCESVVLSGRYHPVSEVKAKWETVATKRYQVELGAESDRQCRIIVGFRAATSEHRHHGQRLASNRCPHRSRSAMWRSSERQRGVPVVSDSRGRPAVNRWQSGTVQTVPTNQPSKYRLPTKNQRRCTALVHGSTWRREGELTGAERYYYSCRAMQQRPA